MSPGRSPLPLNHISFACNPAAFGLGGEEVLDETSRGPQSSMPRKSPSILTLCRGTIADKLSKHSMRTGPPPRRK